MERVKSIEAARCVCSFISLMLSSFSISHSFTRFDNVGFFFAHIQYFEFSSSIINQVVNPIYAVYLF